MLAILYILSGFAISFLLGNLLPVLSSSRIRGSPQASGWIWSAALSSGFALYAILQAFLLRADGAAAASVILRIQGACLALTLSAISGFGATLGNRKLDAFDYIAMGAYWLLAFWSALSPAVITTAARTPLAPSSAMMLGTVSGGVAMTARSGTPSNSRTDVTQACSSTWRCFGLSN